MAKKTRKLLSGGRRQFLKSLAAIGISGEALRHMSKESLAAVTSDPTKEVPRLRGLQHTNHEAVMNENAPPEREPIYYTIPRDEWAYNEGVQNAAVRTKQKLDVRLSGCGSSSGPGYITAMTKETVSGHQKRREVVVKHITLEGDEPDVGIEELKSKAPSKIDGRANGATDSEVVEDIPVQSKKKISSTKAVVQATITTLTTNQFQRVLKSIAPRSGPLERQHITLAEASMLC